MRRALDGGVLRGVYDRVAGRYDVQHALGTAWADERGRRMLVAAAVREGDLVLDAGGGTGSTAILAARAAGANGRVVLLDLSRNMLAVAVRRVRAAGLEARVLVQVGDIMRLPFRAGAFDVVLSSYSICPLYDPASGALELYRAVKPGGVLGIVHSAEPKSGVIGWLAARVESMVWRWPALSLGCRPVSVLERLCAIGARTVYERRIGTPLWPFQLFIVRKPAGAAPRRDSVPIM